MSSPEAVHLRNVAFGYDPKTPVLRVHELVLETGKRVFLYGPSGSGKTTLLGLITGILQPQQGSSRSTSQAFAVCPPGQHLSR